MVEIVVGVDGGNDCVAKAWTFGADGAAELVGRGFLPQGRVGAEGAGEGGGPARAVGVDAVVVPGLDDVVLDGLLGLAVDVADGGVGEEAAGGDGDGGERIGIGRGGDEPGGIDGGDGATGGVEDIAGGLTELMTDGVSSCCDVQQFNLPVLTVLQIRPQRLSIRARAPVGDAGGCSATGKS